jgi:peroxin-19
MSDVWKFPDYLKSHPDLPPEDKKRYQEQLRLSGEIVAVFDQPAYSDGNTIASGEILKLMTEVNLIRL